MKKSIHLFMKLSASFGLLAILLMPTRALAQTYENFDNLNLGSSPGDGNFIGNNGNPWTYQNCRGDVEIYESKAITLGVGGAFSILTCAEITGRLNTLSFDLMQVGPEPATVFVFAGGNYIGSRTTGQQGLVVNSEPFNVSGGLDMEIQFTTNTNGKEVTLDNITWTLVPDNVETFDKLMATEDYNDGDFIGENGHKWTYSSSSEGTVNGGPAITFQEAYGSLYCEDISNGMNTLSFNYRQNSSVPVNLEIYINDVLFTTILSDAPNQLKSTGELVVDVASDGNDSLKINIENLNDDENNIYGGEVTIDNIAWNNRPFTYTEFTATGNWSDDSRWSSGVPDGNSDAFIKGNATVDAPAVAAYMSIEPQGTITLQASTLTASTLTVNADATGSGSLIGPSTLLNLGDANMIWHISSGVPNAWHLLSSPIPDQQFYNYANGFAPSGTYPDGTGYDFYAWDEPSEMWLNRKVSSNNINSFIPGKGYLVAYQDISVNKIFTSYFTNTFNSGTITIPVTAHPMGNKSSNGIHASTNLLGNPYPSSIDWKSSALDRNNLKSEEGGYVLYIWDDITKNYGTYNHNSASDVGTLGVSRYIPPLQGFFVIAQTSGNFVFNDAARVHSSQMYMKSGNEEGFRLSVQAPDDAGKDEILLDFGHAENQGGAEKWKSMSAEAPSLYVSSNEKDYSIRFLSSVSDNPLIPVAFKAGMNGEYTIRASFSTASLPSVQLKDLLTGNIHNLSANPEYTFTAGTGDDANRFVLIFGALGIDHPESESGIQVYAHAGILYLNSQSKATATVKVYNLTGQLVMEGKAGGNALTTLNASHLGTGVYLVNLITDEKVISQKVAFTR